MALFRQQKAEGTDIKESASEMAEFAPLSAGDPIATLAAGSVLFSWYQFYVKGEEEKGIFVGLWAPTLLAAAIYLQQKDIIRKFKRTLSNF